MEYIKRNIENNLLIALSDTPVVLIQGVRQSGKSTLAKKLAERIDAHQVTFDDQTTLEAARKDPKDFVDQYASGTLIIDEIQLLPSLLRTIKYAVDKDRKPGRFLLTGSADVMHVSGANESLAGRAEKIKLNTLSVGEKKGKMDDFISRIAKERKITKWAKSSSMTRGEYINLICQGGYPEAIKRNQQRRNEFLKNYLSSVLDHDTVEISGLAHLDKLEQVFCIISAQTSEQLVKSKLARSTEIPESSIHAYIRLLKDIYLINELPVWGRNLTNKATARKKVTVADTSIACYLNGFTEDSLSDFKNGAELGSLLETFVVDELFKQQSWSDTQYSLNHYRDKYGREVDIIIELFDKKVIAIEVKASSTVTSGDLSGLRHVQELAGDKFHCGIVLYTGDSTLSFGDNLFVAPISTLWE